MKLLIGIVITDERDAFGDGGNDDESESFVLSAHDRHVVGVHPAHFSSTHRISNTFYSSNEFNYIQIQLHSLTCSNELHSKFNELNSPSTIEMNRFN